MTIKQELITPERASEMLSTMGNNRRLRTAHINRLARDMRNGNFQEGNDSICFDAEGHLINGQHRLYAVIAAGVPIMMTVKYGVSSDSVIDRPTVRSTSDTLKMQGVVDEDLCTRECISIVNAYINIKYPDCSYWTDSDKGDFIANNEDSLRFAIATSHKSAKHAVLQKAGPQAALFAAHKLRLPEDKLIRFAECVNTGLCNGEKEWAATILRNFLIETTSTHGGMRQKEQASVTEQAIQDFMAGKGRRRPYKPDKHIYIVPAAKEDRYEQI